MRPQPKPQTARAIQAALEHHRAGRLPEARKIYRQVLEAEPRNLDALHLLGTMAHQLGQHALAVDLFDKALAIRPGLAEVLCNRGVALEALGRHGEALASYDRALEFKPDYVMASSNRGNVLAALGRYDEALASCERALAREPDRADALCNRGVALEALGRHGEALADYDRALAIGPGAAKAWRNRGNALASLKRYGEALASFDRAVAIDPDYAEAHWNQALLRLRLGDFERGWKEHEWRWRWDGFPMPGRRLPQPLWLGREELAGKTVLLHCEQGLGDTIQFCRYAQAVGARGARVILQVQPALQSLLSDMTGVDRVLGVDEALPEFDCHCPLLSLPLAFDTRLDTVPATVPYLGASAAMLEKWEHKLPPKGAPRIGIAWSGNPGQKNDPNRSIALEKLLGAFAESDATLVSLQKEVRPGDEGVLAANPRVLHFGPELESFSDTAALETLMDLIVTVDTSVAHLAGALGKPVWILLAHAADWRWLEDRADCPWYPTARLYRQPASGDWGGALERVRGELNALARPSSPRP